VTEAVRLMKVMKTYCIIFLNN